MHRGGLIRKTRFVQRAKEPIATAVAGKHAAGAIAAVRRRRQADNQQPRLGIAEAGDGLAPIFIFGKAFHFFARHLLAPGDEPRASRAGDDLLLERKKCFFHRFA